ncbi:DUF3298 and DUF4163 domain-containing protein [Yeosuana marina]|uniref:DUF3298 and DUF4163 domain-containing protein n=1 Tax=Yeosuana marina TaxID=1565536 RepID=UPI0030ECB789|tara:strand:+ start:50 stop:769 length:720 start_codon:yes stop_codon:yes gene_type:complete
MKRYLFILCCFFTFISCKEDPLITFKETSITDGNNSAVEVNIPLAEGDTPAVNSINSIIKNKVIASLQIGEYDDDSKIETIKKSIDAFNQEFDAFKNDFPDSDRHWEAQIDGDIMYQSESLISIALTSYMDTGGAHGNLNISFLNFNAKTGKLIANTDLFNDKKAFFKLAKTYYQNNIDEKDAVFDSENFVLPANIGYTEDGIILLYNTYEIAAYSAGTIEFTIPYDDVNSLLVFDTTQ